MELIIIPVFALLGGIVQSITGFGGVIVMMLIMPTFFNMTLAAGIASATSIFLTSTLVIKNRKSIKYKEIIWPIILYLSVCTACIFISANMDSGLIKKCFGVFLVLVALYNFFIKAKTDKPLSLPVSIIFIIISGVCSSFFGIGGPLMIVYYASRIHDRKEFIGTSQFFFFITGIYNMIIRFCSGIIGFSDMGYVVLGGVFIAAGALIGSKIASKIKPDMLKKLTYATVGVAGVLNIFI